MNNLVDRKFKVDQHITKKLIILVMPNADLGNIGAVLEPLKAANSISAQHLFDWEFQSIDGKSVALSCGANIMVNSAIGDTKINDILVICGSDDENICIPEKASNWIRKQYRWGRKIIVLGNGIFALAQAGILSGADFVVHWNSMNVFRELYPNLEPLNQLYVPGVKISSCAGSLSATDLIISLIQVRFGEELALSVQNKLNLPTIRFADEAQRIPTALLYGTRNRSFLKAMEIISKEGGEYLSVGELCIECGVSLRQLQRLFSKYTGRTPRDFLMDIRLKKARELLTRTNMTSAEVAFAVGFDNKTNFRNNFKKRYGSLPTSVPSRPIGVVRQT